MNTNLRYVFSIAMLFLSFYGYGQLNYWRETTNVSTPEYKHLRNLKQEKHKTFSLDEKMLRNMLQGIPMRNSRQASSTILKFPDETGKYIDFVIYEAPVLAQGLTGKYPNIRSYIGYSREHSNSTIRFSLSPSGFQSMMRQADGNTVFIEKRQKGINNYIAYTRSARTTKENTLVCTTKGEKQKKQQGNIARDNNDKTLRRYRLAVSTTGEYTIFHGGTVADALAAINATMTRVNAVFEADLGVTLEVIANTDQVIFTDAATDPYTSSLNSEVQSELTAVIGEANYDIGHLFHQDANNGNAGCIGCVCTNGQKGSGFSATTSPIGDIFDIDYVAHEVGHQFGANHTWSFQSEGTNVQVEPGSGSTIMAYAGITGQNDVQSNSDPYFHYFSIFQVTDFIATTACDIEIPLGNNPPVANAGNDYVIPASTAFILEGSGFDLDGGVLTYTWEQIDNGIVPYDVFGSTNNQGANFRSLPPTTSPIRYMPRLSRVLTGALTQTNPTNGDVWETVSDVSREMNFAFVVRDNVAGGGQTHSDTMKVTVEGSAGPFVVTSHNTGNPVEAGTVEIITWDVANTDVAPISALTVDILLSSDGGLTFPITLAQGVANDGSHGVVIPGGLNTNNARILIRGGNNIFFALNSNVFAIQEADFVMQFPIVEAIACQPNDLILNFDYNTFSGFSETTVFSIPDLPAGLSVAFNPASTSVDGTSVQMTISGTNNVPAGIYPITIIATAPSLTKEINFSLIISSALSDVVLNTPLDGAMDVSLSETLTWIDDPQAATYNIEIATDAGFNNIIDAATVISNAYVPVGLQGGTTYYWHVRPENECGMGAYNTPFSFTTIAVNCNTFTANDTPVAISPSGTPTVNSVLTVTDNLAITDVNVTLDISHTYVSDLTIRLVSPSGTSVTLVSQRCGGSENIQGVFDDDGNAIVCGFNPAISGTVLPLQTLAVFNGEATMGDWTLIVEDAFDLDGGAINTFSIELCAEGEFILDADGDGIADADDNCPFAANIDQADNDNDGEGDVCDTDDDNDGILDVDDNCPFIANANQLDTDNDGEGDVCDADDDNDGILDVNDNCPLVANTDQLDTDNDGEGDVCDVDDDNDGIDDTLDNCPLAFNPNQLDIDNDGEGDVCDEDILVSEALTPNGDGINDTWNIINIEDHPNAIVTVYNRYGNEVFKAKGYFNNWDGFYKNRSERLPAGSYYYQIDLSGNGNIDLDGWLYITY
ncbi:reprolysin-like metallopeptidase [Leptobacterium sp. I13]|uniref:reprolysin-like metallopeptidase n=1 Tax=Leptobacterium meishanense TaxID=3128904 RepID=UPI0030ED075E